MTDFFKERIKLFHRLQGLINALGDDIREILESALETVSGKIIVLEAKADKTASLVYKKKYLEKQKAEIEKVLNEIYEDIGKTIREKSIETGQASPEITNNIFKKVIPPRFEIKMGIPHLTKKRVVAWFESSQIDGLFFNDWLKKLKDNTVARIIRETRKSLVSGESRMDTIKRIQNALEVGRKSAQGLAHNAIRQAQSWADREYFIENAERFKGLRFVAELDRQTTPTCQSLDGQVFKIDECPQPPLHWLCRSHIEPVFKNEELEKYMGEQKRIARIDTEARTVKHRDGTRSTKYEKLRVKFPERKLTYNQWLTSMVKSKNPADVAFAREVLGPTRFKLVANGKLKMESLYYHGKLRTIKELKELMK